MSILIGTKTKNHDLESLLNDKWNATVFMNKGTFSEDEIRYYPYKARNTYRIIFEDIDLDPVDVYATDADMAIQYIKTKYEWSVIQSILKVNTEFYTVYKKESD